MIKIGLDFYIEIVLERYNSLELC